MADHTSDLDELRASLPVDQIAGQLGEDPDDVRRAVDVALPALLGGLRANAEDPGGEASLAEALGQHDASVATPPIDLADVDPQDGERITAHIFGGHQDQVVHQLGSTGAGSSLVQKLLPILAPIVLSYVAKQMGAKGGAAGGGVLGTVLSSILAGAAQGAGGSPRSQPSGGLGGVLGDLLGGLLGGGRKG
ncbi:hypothetical protein ASC64_13335 [Nocardioides sp. Root122]|uniref:DUF937 domain-containing protein n=1 Tax=Nocardioides TaxID=1839 RepID=UPI0007036D62|nr:MULTISPECIES: DUF937 domain-containing protein [Nocardioides]KQV65865.1 hypothetical protein ASC64_13335 [Nocardioides sp. Root122]MCK9823205.1 DUF937 domain-containing protein [Nocardioides cavernae]